MKATPAANKGDLDAAEAARDDDSVSNASTTLNYCQGRNKRSDDDNILLALQNRVKESGEILKGLSQKEEIMTPRRTFATYVFNTLMTMSQANFKQVNVFL